MVDPAIILLAHGSPDPQWLNSARQTEAALRELAPTHTVAVATLGGDHGTGLDDVVLGQIGAGHRAITIVALFLSAGGRHVKRDIPERVRTLTQQHPGVVFRLSPGALGDDPEVTNALAAAALRAALDRA